MTQFRIDYFVLQPLYFLKQIAGAHLRQPFHQNENTSEHIGDGHFLN